MRRPVDTVAGIYEAFGDQLTGEARAAIEAYVTANGKGKRGMHRYDLAGLGLDPPELAERFAPYVDRYDIPAEPIE